MAPEPSDPGRPFVGRREEFGRCAPSLSSLRDQRRRLVTIVGMPGSEEPLRSELSVVTDELLSTGAMAHGPPRSLQHAFAPFADVVKAEAGILDRPRPTRRLLKLDVTLQRVACDRR